MIAIKQNDLRELFCDRNPGDARVKVGSERDFASSDNFAKSRCRRDLWLLLSISPAGTLQIDGFH